ncbi:hypothetical protein CJ760_08925 [Listeria monocytogenes]|uniref:hypothetical protein n=1 Tax=Listeria TaxID=1637 RepID=UPI000BE11D08|nr:MULTISPECIES: hypothetical protein [Listeria]EHC5243883.1 hypothetical protein [Listeria monocytogenes serotype 1/2a]EAC2725784.1 hypothetical protein [Listeria monocytogenes]EAC3179517.1 hypothetical protein [Listeria monocytogenes]EAC6224664.1 hypothetical protein [Listeria monocytogenes]EAC6731273.1 hypothetical protein [Listeria monocytogenes]
MKAVLINEGECQKDLDSMWDLNNVEAVIEKLAEMNPDELAEGDLVNLLCVLVWSEYHPFGLFKFIGIEDECMKFQYLEIEWL